MWYFFVCPFPKLCPVTLPYIQDGCHGLWSIEKLEIFKNLLLNHSMEWNQIWSNLKKIIIINSIFLFTYDLRNPGYSWGLHTFNTHKTILHITIRHIISLRCRRIDRQFSETDGCGNSYIVTESLDLLYLAIAILVY